MPDDEPTADDWRVVGETIREVTNGLNAALGFPPIPPATEHRRPTFEELAAWERAFPGSSARLVGMAQAQARHRRRMERAWAFWPLTHSGDALGVPVVETESRS